MEGGGGGDGEGEGECDGNERGVVSGWVVEESMWLVWIPDAFLDGVCVCVAMTGGRILASLAESTPWNAVLG